MISILKTPTEEKDLKELMTETTRTTTIVTVIITQTIAM
jgi:hypothetical protein